MGWSGMLRAQEEGGGAALWPHPHLLATCLPCPTGHISEE